ncbi:unnamed protein product [Parnassius apollo]|uniref:(apollo) hypothetical protein n=1 Tax=Parnassius apollo TaxID=110799 RepID=A0A8S3WFF5_PARAO|nr:unnamed protein product [Parnassius apollo]
MVELFFIGLPGREQMRWKQTQACKDIEVMCLLILRLFCVLIKREYSLNTTNKCFDGKKGHPVLPIVTDNAMIIIYLLWSFGLAAVTAAPNGLQVLFPELHRQYSFVVKTNSSSGILAPREGNTFWTLEGRLLVTVYDNYTKVRFKLDDLKTSYQSEEAARFLKKTWEAEYQANGLISGIYVGDEPVWATNMKRALTVNFQMKKETGTYGNYEPCLYENCLMVYTVVGESIKKYCSLKVSSANTEHSWSSVPWTQDYVERNVPEVISTSERVYEFDEKRGLICMSMNGNFQYKIHDHILYVASELSLYYDMDVPVESIEKLNLSRREIQYDAGDYRNPSNFIKVMTQHDLKNRTYEV